MSAGGHYTELPDKHGLQSQSLHVYDDPRGSTAALLIPLHPESVFEFISDPLNLIRLSSFVVCFTTKEQLRAARKTNVKGNVHKLNVTVRPPRWAWWRSMETREASFTSDIDQRLVTISTTSLSGDVITMNFHCGQ